LTVHADELADERPGVGEFDTEGFV
jgi:hypothetical protein